MSTGTDPADLPADQPESSTSHNIPSFSFDWPQPSEPTPQTNPSSHTGFDIDNPFTFNTTFELPYTPDPAFASAPGLPSYFDNTFQDLLGGDGHLYDNLLNDARPDALHHAPFDVSSHPPHVGPTSASAATATGTAGSATLNPPINVSEMLAMLNSPVPMGTEQNVEDRETYKRTLYSTIDRLVQLASSV